MITSLRQSVAPWALLSLTVLSVVYFGASNAYADDEFDCCGRQGACVVVNRDLSCEGSGECENSSLFNECCEQACGTGGGPPV